MNFVDVAHLWNLTLEKWATYCTAELLADPFVKIKSQKTENQPFAEFKYLEINQLYGSISTKNLAGVYIKIFTSIEISHNAHNHLMDLITIAFCCSRLCYSG